MPLGHFYCMSTVFNDALFCTCSEFRNPSSVSKIIFCRFSSKPRPHTTHSNAENSTRSFSLNFIRYRNHNGKNQNSETSVGAWQGTQRLQCGVHIFDLVYKTHDSMSVCRKRAMNKTIRFGKLRLVNLPHVHYRINSRASKITEHSLQYQPKDGHDTRFHTRDHTPFHPSDQFTSIQPIATLQTIP